MTEILQSIRLQGSCQFCAREVWVGAGPGCEDWRYSDQLRRPLGFHIGGKVFCGVGSFSFCILYFGLQVRPMRVKTARHQGEIDDYLPD